jgi:hypothetical protein
MEQDKRAYLKDDVFATPGSAAVWWLVNHPGEVENALGLLDTLAELSAAANDLPIRPASAGTIEPRQPTRAELAFSAAVDDLAETAVSDTGGARSPIEESRQRLVARYARARRADNHPSARSAKSEVNGSATKQAQSSEQDSEYRERFSTE